MTDEWIKELTYFSAADRQIEDVVDRATFERRLLEHVLFHPGPLIPDVFFFVSTHVAEHVKTGAGGLLGAALAAGLARPAFRDAPHAWRLSGADAAFFDSGFLVSDLVADLSSLIFSDMTKSPEACDWSSHLRIRRARELSYTLRGPNVKEKDMGSFVQHALKSKEADRRRSPPVAQSMR